MHRGQAADPEDEQEDIRVYLVLVQDHPESDPRSTARLGSEPCLAWSQRVAAVTLSHADAMAWAATSEHKRLHGCLDWQPRHFVIVRKTLIGRMM